MSTAKRTSSLRRKRLIAALGMAAVVALTGSAAALVDVAGGAEGKAEVEVDDLDDLGPLVEVGDVTINGTTVSVGHNFLRDAEILNDVDIQIGES